MNKNVNAYAQLNTKCIEILCNKKKNYEKFIKILTLVSVAVLLGIATGVYFSGTGSIVGYLTYATAVVVGGAMMHKESADTRKYYEKEKKHISGLKDRDSLIYADDNTYKHATNAICKHESSIKEKEKKLKGIEGTVNMARFGVVLTSVLSFTNPQALWATAAAIALYTATGIYKIAKNADLAKENFELNSLKREIKIDEILRKEDEEEAQKLEEIEMKDKVQLLGNVKVEFIVKQSPEKEMMAEKIVEHIIKTSNQEEEKPKIHVKRKEGK